jgi:hypothetical protein
MFLTPMVGWSAKPIFTFVASVETTAIDITIPTAAAIGDLAVLISASGRSGSYGRSLLTGWTDLGSDVGAWSDNYGIQGAEYKILVSGDPGSTDSGMNGAGSGYQPKIMFVFRPSKPLSSVATGTWTFQATGGDPTLQTVTVASLSGPLIVFSGISTYSATPIYTTISPAFTSSLYVSDNRALAGYKIHNSGPVNSSFDCSDEGSMNFLCSGYIQGVFS